MLEVKNLTLTKSRISVKFTLLNDLSFQIATHKTTLFLGKSGSGKTSILRCLSQIERKYQGEILYNGQRIDRLSQKERSQLIGFVPQAYALFPFMSVLENCTHPLRVILGCTKKEAEFRAEEMIASLGMESLIHHYPHELSGGQQQRAAIIRALLLKPTFLLLDEPTSALDPENTDLLIQIILRLKKEGKAVIVSSQDMLFSQKIADRAYFMERGMIVEEHDLALPEAETFRQSKLAQFLYSKQPEKVAF